MKNKIIEFFEKSVTSEIILKRIAFYLFLICILLGLVFFKLNEINENILSVSANSVIVDTKTEKESVADIFIEEKGEIGDVLPLYDEIKETTETTTKNNSETTADNKENESITEVSTSQAQSSKKYNFVINVSSNKMHYADCSFVNRMKEENRKSVQLSDTELKEYLNSGYTLCSTCGG